MENKFVYNLESFFMEMQIESLRNYQEEDFEYESSRKAFLKDDDEWKRIVNTLPQEEKEFMNNYEDTNNEITGMEFDRVYLQGYKDCIKLFKYIGAFSSI